jgi:hypothetical protein
MNTEKVSRFFGVLGLLVGTPAVADFDLPATFTFDFAASETGFSSFSDVGQTSDVLAEAYLNTAASSFGESGVLVWARFALPGEEGRLGVMLLDLDLATLGFATGGELPPSSLRLEYLEKVEDRVVFRADLSQARVVLVDAFFSGSDQDAAELKLEILLNGAEGYPGGRAMLRGSLITDPSPGELRRRYLGPGYTGGDSYVSTGCSSDVYLADSQGCDCGGTDEDYQSTGCEGDSAGSGGCAGDTASDASCQSSGCEGDTSGGASCSDSSDCAIAGRPRTRLRALPQIAAMFWLAGGRFLERILSVSVRRGRRPRRMPG